MVPITSVATIIAGIIVTITVIATTVTIPHITVVAIVTIIPPARIRAATRIVTLTLKLTRRFRAT